jgi:hypothetical protein
MQGIQYTSQSNLLLLTSMLYNMPWILHAYILCFYFQLIGMNHANIVHLPPIILFFGLCHHCWSKTIDHVQSQLLSMYNHSYCPWICLIIVLSYCPVYFVIWRMPSTPRAQGRHWNDTQHLCHACWRDPSGLSVGHGTPHIEDASYLQRLGATNLKWWTRRSSPRLNSRILRITSIGGVSWELWRTKEGVALGVLTL